MTFVRPTLRNFWALGGPTSSLPPRDPDVTAPSREAANLWSCA